MGRRRNRNNETVAKQDSAFERAQRSDDYVNTYTGIGDWTQDKMFGGQNGSLGFFVRLLTQREAEDRWRGSDLGGRIIEAIPDEMTREGWELSIQPSQDNQVEDVDAKDPQDPKQDAFGAMDPTALLGEPKNNVKPIEPADDEPGRICEEVEAKLEELGAFETIVKALQYERAYGGSLILVGADDGASDLTVPLDEENVSDIRYMNPFSGGRDGEAVAWSYYTDPRSAKYGTPEIYQIRNKGVPVSRAPVPGSKISGPQRFIETVFYVHESRVLLFPGNAVSLRARSEALGWGDSIFTRLDEVLSQYSQTWGGVANLMAQFHMDVLKMSGLQQGMAMGDKSSKGNPLTNRARLINKTKSIARMLVIDTEEEFERATASLAGVDTVLQQFAMRLAAAADMPVDLLFSPMHGGALNKGDSTVRMFYDRIAAKQKRQLLPQLKKLYRLIMLSKEGPCEGVEPDQWNVKFNPLTQLTELEQATLRKTVAETDQIYITGGVLSAEEVAASAYGGSEWSMERTIDFEGRKTMAAQDEKDQAERKTKTEALMKQAMQQPQPAAPAKPPAK